MTEQQKDFGSLRNWLKLIQTQIFSKKKINSYWVWLRLYSWRVLVISAVLFQMSFQNRDVVNFRTLTFCLTCLNRYIWWGKDITWKKQWKSVLQIMELIRHEAETQLCLGISLFEAFLILSRCVRRQLRPASGTIRQMEQIEKFN